MPIAQILQSLKGTCRFCRQQADLLQRDHQDCQETHRSGWQEMVQLAAQAASAHTFNEAALRQTLQAIANRSRATGEDIDRALEEGFRQGVAQAMSDGIITRDEEENALARYADYFSLTQQAVHCLGQTETEPGLDRMKPAVLVEALLLRVLRLRGAILRGNPVSFFEEHRGALGLVVILHLVA